MLNLDRSIYDKDGSLLQLAKGGKRVIGKSSLLGLKSHRTGMFKNSPARSISTSPSIGATRTPVRKSFMPSMSNPIDMSQEEQRAIHESIIHLLAIRPVSKEFVSKHVKCTTHQGEALMNKYGKASDSDRFKYGLKDKGYKELDIWKFPYNSDDRQLVIEQAVSAFDRLRISREEKVWQMLLPKLQRNQGIILSKLQLHLGPMQKVSTPRINVQHTGGASKEFRTDGSDEDQHGRLVPSDADSGARSEPNQKKKMTEKEAQSKRLLSKNPKKATQAAKAKESKLPTKGSKTSVVTKETSKSTASSAVKVKSSEFVHDSDEDVEIDDTLTIIDPDANKITTNSKQRQSSEKPKPTPAVTAPKSKVTAPTTVQKSTSTPKTASMSSDSATKKSTATNSSSSSSDQRTANGLQKPVPMQRKISHNRNISSPIKPSPLGSSPPTNASDLDNEGRLLPTSSAKNSPAITAATKGTETPTNKGVARKITRPVADTSERQQAIEGSKKRKAEDVDANSGAHGKGAATNGTQRPAKRHQVAVPSPSLSDSSGSPTSPVLRETLKKAKKFKEYYAQYEKMHRELSAALNPLNDQVERLIKMHNRLETMKAEIVHETTA